MTILTVNLKIWDGQREVSKSGIESLYRVGILQDVAVDYDQKRGVWTVQSVAENEYKFKAEGLFRDEAILNWLKARVGFGEQDSREEKA